MSACSCRKVDVDLDWPEARRYSLDFLNLSGIAFGRVNGNVIDCTHLIYRCELPYRLPGAQRRGSAEAGRRLRADGVAAPHVEGERALPR